MTLQHSISSLGTRLRSLLSILGSKTLPHWGDWARDLFARVRQTLLQAATYAQSQTPLVRSYWGQLLDWARGARERLRRIDIGAQTVQTVGAAVVVGTLYVAIWGVGPSQISYPPELIATRTAPIGTLTLQESAAPQVAEQGSLADPTAASM